MKLRPYYIGDLKAINAAIDLLRKARYLLRASDSPKAASAVQRALKSAEGAARHGQRRKDACKGVMRLRAPSPLFHTEEA